MKKLFTSVILFAIVFISISASVFAQSTDASTEANVSPQYVPCPILEGPHQYTYTGQTGPFQGGQDTHSQVYWVGDQRYEIVCTRTYYYNVQYYACICGATTTSEVHAYTNHSESF